MVEGMKLNQVYYVKKRKGMVIPVEPVETMLEPPTQLPSMTHFCHFLVLCDTKGRHQFRSHVINSEGCSKSSLCN